MMYYKSVFLCIKWAISKIIYCWKNVIFFWQKWLDTTAWRMLCRRCRHRPRSSCVCPPSPHTPKQTSLWRILQKLVVESDMMRTLPHLAPRPLLLGALRPVPQLPSSLAVINSVNTICCKSEIWTFIMSAMFIIRCIELSLSGND